VVCFLDMVGLRYVVVSLCAVVFAGVVQAATLSHVSDFEGSDKDGWQHPVATPLQTSIQMDGPHNQVLLVSSSGGTGAGSRLVVPNLSAPWIGDYTAAGITAVQMDLVNNSGINLAIRVGLEGGAPGNRWTSIVPVSLAPSERGTFRFELDSSSMSTAGGNDLTSALADVSQIRILHNLNAGDFKGAKVAGSFTVDNMALVPEPSSVSLFLLGSSILFCSRNRHQNRQN
jgi:hypothetical protein